MASVYTKIRNMVDCANMLDCILFKVDCMLKVGPAAPVVKLNWYRCWSWV